MKKMKSGFEDNPAEPRLAGRRRQTVFLLTIILLRLVPQIEAASVSLDATGSGWYGLAQTSGPFGRKFFSPLIAPDGTGKKVTVNDNGNLTDTTGFFHYAATLTGEGKVNYGSFIDSIHFVLTAMPESVDTQLSHINNDGHAEVVSHLTLGFSDSGIVASNTLPAGTPVVIKVIAVSRSLNVLSEPTGIPPFNNPYPNGENAGVDSSGYVTLFDEQTLVELNGAPYFQNSITSYSFNTAVGHRLDLSAQNVANAAGYAGAFQNADGSRSFYPQAEGTTDVVTQVFLSGPAGASFTFDSGHNYVPGNLRLHALKNISTRGFVGTGNIAGLIVSGSSPKRVVLRALGPTLGRAPFNVPGALGNPTLELHAANGALITSNDTWTNSANVDEIRGSGFAPPDSLEAAILTTLNPGNYTAIVRGANNTTGVALIEGYDLDAIASSRFGNISTRGFVQTGNNVMIAGLIVQGPDNQQVLVRGLGPTLAQPPFNVPNVLANPLIDLRDAQGTRILANDNWKSSQQSQITATGLAPPADVESAILTTLAPGNYTAILSGVNNATGNALIEAYALN
ncbi:MAG: hypothetical protein DMF04_12080 [Verrucomicrobia bacterium]|nr:MAG: hypothetical protein DMF04_12080 [Verrucomicrobiota bacterium]